MHTPGRIGDQGVGVGEFTGPDGAGDALDVQAVRLSGKHQVVEGHVHCLGQPAPVFPHSFRVVAGPQSPG
jgi:hypothetical protein